MSKFARSFALAKLEKWDAEHAGNAVRTLFDRSALPGEKASDPVRLRVGLRDGYINFYVKGQSVAKLSYGREGPRLSVHEAYVAGRAKGTQRNGPIPAKPYEDFTAEWLSKPGNASVIQSWIEKAETYASAEKRFVDDLVAANPGVIDLEMGLPADDVPGGVKVAPRMDLVVAQIGQDGTPTIAFWEAKCANNPELRSSQDYQRFDDDSFTGPKVLNQIRKYVDWMSDDRIAQARDAYRETAGCFLEFHRVFGRSRDNSPDCIAVWKALAQAEDPAVIVQPGLVIGNYWPERCKEGIASGRMVQAAANFARKGHRAKLDNVGISVHEVDATPQARSLPLLPIVQVVA